MSRRQANPGTGDPTTIVTVGDILHDMAMMGAIEMR